MKEEIAHFCSDQMILSISYSAESLFMDCCKICDISSIISFEILTTKVTGMFGCENKREFPSGVCSSKMKPSGISSEKP